MEAIESETKAILGDLVIVETNESNEISCDLDNHL